MRSMPILEERECGNDRCHAIRLMEPFLCLGDKVSYRAEVVEGVDVSVLLDSLRHVYANGGVILRSFRAENSSRFRSSNDERLSGDGEILRMFLTQATVIAALPDLRIEPP